MQNLGFVLLIGGVIFLLFGLVKKSRSTSGVTTGSVSIGRDNSGQINVTSNINTTPNNGSIFWTVWNILSGTTGFIGLALTIWPIK